MDATDAMDTTDTMDATDAMDSMDTWNDDLVEISRLFKHALEHTNPDDDKAVFLLKFVAGSLSSALETLRILHDSDDAKISAHYEETKANNDAYIRYLILTSMFNPETNDENDENGNLDHLPESFAHESPADDNTI